MSQLRLNPMTGRWVTIAGERALRPADFARHRLPVEAEPGRPCPFCPGNEEATPPALETYGRDGGWQVRVVPNLYPAFTGNEVFEVREVGQVFAQAPGSGIHEVLVLTPDHAASWADLDDLQAGLVMAAVRDRMEDHARQPAVHYTQMIVNHGREAGASLEHPHGQLLGMPFVPGELTDEFAGFARHDGCLLCTVAAAEAEADVRVVQQDERVQVCCPFWSGTPYEMLVIPRHHEATLEQAAPADLVAVGRGLRDALARLRSTVEDAPYNVVFHTAPHRHEGPFHWHVHVLPRLTSVAGFEQGTGVMINVVAPEVAAEQLVRAGEPAIR
jgi:UDPglucose--hexose-1-phosphate uridylyltransferase